MKNILHISDPNVYARSIGAPVLHPLVSVIHYDEVSPVRTSLNQYGVYGLFIQRNFPKHLTYGMKMFDPAEGSIFATEPVQIGGKEDDGEDLYIQGWALLFSPELIRGTDLEARMKDYHFFSYFATESLQMEPSEWLFITQLISQMRQELEMNEDSPSLRKVLLGYLRLLLEYCNRIYLRQLSAETKDTTDILKRFHALLEQYFFDGKQHQLGLPTVSYCASEMAYSSHYFGDLFRRATGTTAINYIHTYVINIGKSLLMQGHNISETSRMLGFEFPHHFTRLFKKITGITPSEFLGK
jgi:AraC-like DNA-binding protein